MGGKKRIFFCRGQQCHSQKQTLPQIDKILPPPHTQITPMVLRYEGNAVKHYSCAPPPPRWNFFGQITSRKMRYFFYQITQLRDLREKLPYMSRRNLREKKYRILHDVIWPKQLPYILGHNLIKSFFQKKCQKKFCPPPPPRTFWPKNYGRGRT